MSSVESFLSLSSLAAGAGTSSAAALVGAADTGTASSLYNLPADDEVLIACAAPLTSFDNTIESVESFDDEADAGIVLASSLDVRDSHQLYYSTPGTNGLDLSNSAKMTATGDVTDSVALAYANVPSSIDFTDSLVPGISNGSFITSSLSNPSGTSEFDTVSSCLTSSSYPADTIPEPMTIWALWTGSLLFLQRRKRT